jgi:hypothetical protein
VRERSACNDEEKPKQIFNWRASTSNFRRKVRITRCSKTMCVLLQNVKKEEKKRKKKEE